jgi:hypothetical protein
MTEDDIVNIGSEILERAKQEMIAAGISATDVPHVMVCYGTMLISCLCPECRAEQIQGCVRASRSYGPTSRARS